MFCSLKPQMLTFKMLALLSSGLGRFTVGYMLGQRQSSAQALSISAQSKRNLVA